MYVCMYVCMYACMFVCLYVLCLYVLSVFIFLWLSGMSDIIFYIFRIKFEKRGHYYLAFLYLACNFWKH